ncbi:MAG: HAMP domain-containing sensor histidine kinase [Henriciella sp.]|nr:HAMP domain-containing sensor histidine kinase [Henriciella sp.]
MRSSNPAKSVGVLPVTVAVLASGCALVLTFLAGGFGSGIGSLFLFGPVLVWLIWGTSALASAVGAALIGAAGLACFQLLGLVPPAIEPLSAVTGRLLPWGFGAIGLGVLAKLRLRSEGRSLAEPISKTPPPHNSELILPEDGPILILDISRFGRVRTRFGAQRLLPEAQPGQIIGDILRPVMGASDTPWLGELPGGARLMITKLPHQDGHSLLVLNADHLNLQSDRDLNEALSARTAFFASLGHDLKSPLNAILGFADMMDMQVRGPMPAAYKDYPGLIKEGGQTLERLIADFLDYAKSETGAYEIDPAPMDVAASGDSVLRQSLAAAQKAGVRLNLAAEGDVTAMADAGAVRRIWDNLVSNAIKYSGEDQTVELAAVKRGNWVELSVSDQGVGMSEADLAMIAAPFAQGHNAKGRAGTGLGLAMVDRLARLHGGQVKIETAPGAGTRVTVSLPAATSTLQKAAE